MPDPSLYGTSNRPHLGGLVTTAYVELKEIAYARSGDKGNSVNIGVIAYTPEGYKLLETYLTTEVVASYFADLSPTKVVRYELPNLLALNFILEGALGGGGSLSLRLDSQGKALGQTLLQLKLTIPEHKLAKVQP